MAESSMKDIKLRIRSVESTMQITKAMELVASSKLRRAKENVEQSRPYFTILKQTLGGIARGNTDFTSVFTQQREVKRTCYIVIGGDRGLAGGYNANIFKAVSEHIGEADVTILPIGKKSLEFFRRRGYDIVSDEFPLAGDISVSDCFAMAQLLTKKYLAEEFDEVYICYTVFVSMLTQAPRIDRILPLANDEVQEEADEALSKAKGLILYEPSASAVYAAIVPGYLQGVIYSAMCESVASEQGARRTAMDAASRNASDMIDALSLRYNRARQGAITQEITEIVAGAEK